MLALLQLIIDGTILGCTYAVCAIGMVLIFKATDVVNIAQGELMMMAAFFAYTFQVMLGWPFFVSLVAAICSTILLSLVVERVVLRPLMKAPVWTSIMATVALMVILQAGARVTWGPEVYHLPPFFGSATIRLGGINLTALDMAILSISVIYMLLLYLFFKFTMTGKAMRAIQMDKEAASFMGISVKRAFSYVWVLNGILMGTVGILLAPRLGVHSTMGLLMLKGFVVAVIGGFTSFAGSVIGGILLGVIETLAGVYISSAMKDIVSFVILILVLIVRPTGLFAESMTKRV